MKKYEKLEKENAELKAKLKEARYINTGIFRRWKTEFKKKYNHGKRTDRKENR